MLGLNCQQQFLFCFVPFVIELNFMQLIHVFLFQPELKGLIRSGIPHDLRAKIWMKCVNSHVKCTKRMSGSGYYKRLLASKKDNFSPAEKQISLDLLRTLPNNKYYDQQNADGVSTDMNLFHAVF